MDSLSTARGQRTPNGCDGRRLDAAVRAGVAMTARAARPLQRPVEARRASAARLALRVVLPAAVLLLLLSAAALAAVETENVRSYWDGLWWSLSLMTTVGFVGAAPATGLGKVLSAAIMLFGFIALATTTAAVASLFVRQDEFPEERREQGFEQRMLDELRELTRGLAAIERELGRASARTASDTASTAPGGTGPP